MFVHQCAVELATELGTMMAPPRRLFAYKASNAIIFTHTRFRILGKSSHLCEHRNTIPCRIITLD
jgi:hypothetical protein